MNRKSIMIIAGEASGDLHGSNLAQAIHNLRPDVEISGIGGKFMAQSGVKLYYDVVDLAVIGFAEVLKKYRKFRRIFNSLLANIDADPPDAVVLIDFPGFNLRFAQQIKKRSIPIIYYISPQIWAWGENRIKTISQLVDKMIVIFDFEKELYKGYGLDVEFIGHPLLDIVKPTMSHDEAYAYFNLRKNKPTIGLFPGSRKNEVISHLPIMLKAASLINQKIEGVQFLLSKAPTLEANIYHRLLKETRSSIHMTSDKTYDVMNICDLLLVASGTATLEGTILLRPMIIIYKLSFLSWLLARSLIKIPYVGLVNVVARRKICPEFLQYNATPKNIAASAIELLGDQLKLSNIRADLTNIKEKLGTLGASIRCAELILRFLS